MMVMLFLLLNVINSNLMLVMMVMVNGFSDRWPFSTHTQLLTLGVCSSSLSLSSAHSLSLTLFISPVTFLSLWSSFPFFERVRLSILLIRVTKCVLLFIECNTSYWLQAADHWTYTQSWPTIWHLCLRRHQQQQLSHVQTHLCRCGAAVPFPSSHRHSSHWLPSFICSMEVTLCLRQQQQQVSVSQAAVCLPVCLPDESRL